MELILISCSAKKRPEGTDNCDHGVFEKGLSGPYGIKLADCRERISSFNLPGAPANGAPELPAFQKYNGIVFKHGNIATLYPRQTKYQILILSAYFGPLDPYDCIPNYNVKMEDKGGGQRLKTFWKRAGLGLIVENYAQMVGVDRIHNLLPKDYDEAMSSWKTKPTAFHVNRGFKAEFERARYVKSLLSQAFNS